MKARVIRSWLIEKLFESVMKYDSKAPLVGCAKPKMACEWHTQTGQRDNNEFSINRFCSEHTTNEEQRRQLCDADWQWRMVKLVRQKLIKMIVN